MPPVAVLLCLCSLTLWTAADGNVFTTQLTSQIVNFVQNLMQCRGVVGLTLAVVKGNETWTRGFGVADRASERLVNSSTLFGIGSVTKAFTSTILGILMEESQGKYTWQTRLKDILGPDFQLADELLTSHATVKDLLVHRTGLSTSNIPLFVGFPNTLTRKEFASRLRYLPVAGLFRDEFSYNNWMYALAGRVAEVMGGASWEELLHKRIFQPLQMNDSRVIGYNVRVDADNFALPYVQLKNDVVLSDPALYPITPVEPAGAIASSADDMGKWISLHLHGGVTSGGRKILNNTTIQDMHTSQMAITPSFSRADDVKRPQFPVTFNNFGYGYAWLTSTYRDYSVVWHAGGIFSYLTFLALVKSLDLGIFISTNGPGNTSASVALQEVFYYVADVLLGETPWLDADNACSYPRQWLNVTEDSPPDDAGIVNAGFENPQNFAGQYGNALFGDIFITQSGSDELLVNYSRMSGQLRRTKEANVAMMDVQEHMEFLTHIGDVVLYINMTFAELDESGKYRKIVVSAPDMSENDLLVFERGVTFSGLSEKTANGSVNPYLTIVSLWMTCCAVSAHVLARRCL